MLAVQPAASQKCTPNLLSMRINHNGHVENTSRYWTPSTDEKGVKHAYFRGRHLHGTSMPLPDGYKGAVLNITEKTLPQRAQPSQQHHSLDEEEGDMEDEMEQEVPEDVEIAEQIGEFDSITVWGHGGTVDEGDEFMRGVREWVDFAGIMHCDEDDEAEEMNGKDGNGAKKA